MEREKHQRKKLILSICCRGNMFTDRQIQVILFSLQGQTNKEIAKKLILSPRTVEEYWKGIYRRIRARGGHCKTKSQAIKFFLKNLEESLEGSRFDDITSHLQAYKECIEKINYKVEK